jgi:hypothetical protein
MALTPYEAFAEFTSRASSMQGLFATTPDQYRELIDPFLANPEAHREHMDQILQAFGASQMFQQPGMSMLVRPFLKLIPMRMSVWKRFHQRLESLKEKLLQEVQPGEYGIDILPSRRVDGPKEWRDQWDVHLVEVRMSVYPAGNFVADRVALKLTLSDSSSRFIDCFPSTEFAEVGEYEIGLTEEAKFSRSAVAGLGGSLGYSGPGGKIGLEAKASTGAESSESRTVKQRYKFPAKILKLVSSAVGQTVRWEILRAPDEAPTGGLTFLATLMTPTGTASAKIAGSIEIELADWGRLTLPVEAEVKLARRPVAADASAA